MTEKEPPWKETQRGHGQKNRAEESTSPEKQKRCRRPWMGDSPEVPELTLVRWPLVTPGDDLQSCWYSTQAEGD